MRNATKVVALMLPFVLMCSNAIGAGFGLYEFSARGNAMGGAISSGAEPASIAVNPALITDLKGTQMQIGATIVLPTANTTYDGDTSDIQFASFLLPNFYYTQQLNDRWFAGIGLFSRFGLGNSYSRQWVGAQSAYEISVQTVSLQPTVAFKATDRLSVSAGLEAMYLKFQEGNRTYLPSYPSNSFVDTNLEGDSIGFSGILAFAYKANEKVNFGGSYRFKTKQSVEGSSDFAATPGLGAMFSNGDVNGSIMLPNQLVLGASYQATEKLLIEFTWMNIFWSSFKDITINFDKFPGNPHTSGSKSDVKNWNDTYRVGVGVEYLLSNPIALRASYVYDKAPVNVDYMDVFIPANDRQLFSLGLGWKLNDFITADFAYTYLLSNGLTGQTKPVNGKPVSYQDGQAHMGAVSLKYAF